ncbi:MULTISPECIES: hypothetical protein [Flavobacterium]|uniref:Uncharacterized protein n=1 Tax=Flavobacterium chungangense TaxID=554283 RepID=A0A6V6YZS6_9FLAO|nr:MULTISPECIES: hypothetical protein [Flavobacterium]CAD0004819.1 hypothetical protein FLACHUCJ7_02037 [Flavobacterium chungangense]
MSTIDQQDTSCCRIEKPAGIKIKGVKVKSLGYQIKFPNPRHKKPLPPIAQVTINKKYEMQISIVVFISEKTKVTADQLTVIQDFSYTNNKMPYANFYVCYDVAPEPCSTFNIFQLSFKANPKDYTPNRILPKDLPIPDLLKLKEIVTFLWDEDPTGSRGTVTTVQTGL